MANRKSMRKTIPVMIQRLPSAIPVAFPSGTWKNEGKESQQGVKDRSSSV